jgi:beta-glucosidase
VRLSTTVHLDGDPVTVPLSIWSTWGEWRDDVRAGALLDAAIASGGGLRGRVADLIIDETGRQSVLALPMQTLVEFPGFPVGQEQIDEVLAVAAGGQTGFTPTVSPPQT